MSDIAVAPNKMGFSCVKVADRRQKIQGGGKGAKLETLENASHFPNVKTHQIANNQK